MDKREMAGETKDKSSTSEERSTTKVSNIVIDESKMLFKAIIRKTLTICISFVGQPFILPLSGKGRKAAGSTSVLSKQPRKREVSRLEEGQWEQVMSALTAKNVNTAVDLLFAVNA